MRLIYPVVALIGVLAVTGCSHNTVSHKAKPGLASKDYTLTYEQVREAAQDGDADAQYALGYMYYYGQNVTRNSKQAQFWIRKAAAQKHEQAVKALAIMGSGSHLANRDDEPSDGDAAQVTPVRNLASGQNKWEEVRRPNAVAAQTEQFGHQGQKNLDQSTAALSAAQDTANNTATVQNTPPNGANANRSGVANNPVHAGKKHARTMALKIKPGKNVASKSPRGADLSAQTALQAKAGIATQADIAAADTNEPSTDAASQESLDSTTSATESKVASPSTGPTDSAQAAPMLQLAQERTTAPRNAKRVAQKQANLSKAAQSQQAKQAVVASSKAQASLSGKGNTKLTTDERSILSSPSSHYTLQLIGTSSPANIHQVIERNHLQQKAKVYRTQLKGKNFYVLIYGNYPSQADANAEIARLPANVQQLKPWVKQYSSIKASVNTKAS